MAECSPKSVIHIDMQLFNYSDSGEECLRNRSENKCRKINPRIPYVYIELRSKFSVLLTDLFCRDSFTTALYEYNKRLPKLLKADN